MFEKINDATLRLSVAIATRPRRRRGLETVEWVLVGVALVVVAFVAYTTLGGSMSRWINDLGRDVQYEGPP